MATRNERKRRAKVKAQAIAAEISKMIAEQAARLEERDATFAKLAEYPIDFTGMSVVQRTSELSGKVQARAGKRKFVSNTRPYVEPLKPTPDKVPYGTARKRWL